MREDVALLESLSHGFRDGYLSYAELTDQVQEWAEAFPELVRLESLGQSPEGRELWLLTIGRDPDRRRPAAWVDGNLHASEVAGSSVALAIAEDALRLHLDPEARVHELSAPVRARLLEGLLYVLPRVSPDGAEAVLTSRRYVRSVPRDERSNRQHPRWISEDVDGDGRALLMRVPDPTGEFVESRLHPGLMLPRRIDDEGPFYKLYPEGRIEHFDGRSIPSPHFLADNFPDLNRNFPWSWQPEPRQDGAGEYPGSAPESRAIIERATRSPHLFTWLSLHTFGGVFIRPLGAAPDTKMDPEDLAVFRQIEHWAREITGYPTVSGFEEFTYQPDSPLHGDLSDFAYHQRGCLSYVVELWDLFAQLGLPRPKKFVDYYTQLAPEDFEALARWDAESNAGRVLRPWRAHHHPQLGPVEVGGADPLIGLWNPPYERLPEVCAKHSAHWLRVASLAPSVRISQLEARSLGGELHELSATVENHGYLGSFGLPSAKTLPWNEAPWAELSLGDGLALVDPSTARQAVGHLDGWGRGRFDEGSALYFQRSRGSTGRRVLSWIVRGHGKARVDVESCRLGRLHAELEV
jgi:hypothetical protein